MKSIFITIVFPNRNLLFCVFCSGKPIHWCTKQEDKDRFVRTSLHRKYIGKWVLSGRYIPVFKLKTGTQQTRFPKMLSDPSPTERVLQIMRKDKYGGGDNVFVGRGGGVCYRKLVDVYL